MLKRLVLILIFAISIPAFADKILIPMDLAQTDHLKAYGITFWVLTNNKPADWLLNYRGGSFMFDYSADIDAECRIRGVFFETLDGAESAQIYAQAQKEDVNMDVVRLEKPPKIAIYTPPGSRPWDDAVTMAMEYAEIKYEKVWDSEVLGGKLANYDWLHLHHEDFTGQYGKFFASYSNVAWYIQQVSLLEGEAKKLGYTKVSQMKKDVAEKIRQFVGEGGFLFAMCSATDSYDIALSANKVDICAPMFDGDPADYDANAKLDFGRTFAFENFHVLLDPYVYEYSDIDIEPELVNKESDYFTLFDFSAKYDPVPTMLTQCHVNVVKGFMGQTTAFHKRFVKKAITILGEKEGTDQVKYIHGNFGKGTFTWYGGHDPEDYQHFIGAKPTDLGLHKNSPGYRLILNNVLFPAAKKKEQKT